MSEIQSIENRLQHTESRQNQFEKDLATLVSTAKAQSDSIEDLKNLHSKEHMQTRAEIRALADQIINARQGQWPIVIGVMSLVLVSMGGFATFVLLLVNPLRAEQGQIEDRLEERLAQLPHDYYKFGQNSKAIEVLGASLSDLHFNYDQSREQLSYLRGRTEKIDQQLQSVDERGFRRWNSTKPMGDLE